MAAPMKGHDEGKPLMGALSGSSTPTSRSTPTAVHAHAQGAKAAMQLDPERRPHGRHILGLPVSVFAGGAYCTASISMVGASRRLAADACLPPAAAPALLACRPPEQRPVPAPTPPADPPSTPCAQVLLNKIALSSFHFKSPNALLFFQCMLCVAAVQACSLAGLIKLEPLRPGVIRVWLPVNLIFVGMIGTSFWALASLNVGMVTGADALLLQGRRGTRPEQLPARVRARTALARCSRVSCATPARLLPRTAVLKNLTNLFTLGGDYWLYRRTYSWWVVRVLGGQCGWAVFASAWPERWLSTHSGRSQGWGGCCQPVSAWGDS